MADEDRTFSPSDEQATRTRMQGNGVGQTELNAQRDPSRPEDGDGGLDQYSNNPQEDGGDPSMEAQTGSNHTRRPDRTEALRGQGPKTRAHNKAEINRQV
jgi:hypothetical protein